MWPLSHGDVTFQQEAKDEMLREDFVPPGCMAECWVQGCWPRHSITSASAAALSPGPCPAYHKIPVPLIKPLKLTNVGLVLWLKNPYKQLLWGTNITCHHHALRGSWWEWKPTDITKWEDIKTVRWSCVVPILWCFFPPNSHIYNDGISCALSHCPQKMKCHGGEKKRCRHTV